LAVKSKEEHEFTELDFKVERGKLVKYVRCTRCGLLLREQKPK
jgi:hypothetical protein